MLTENFHNINTLPKLSLNSVRPIIFSGILLLILNILSII